MPCDPITCDTFTLRTANITETFYFDDYDVGEAWEDTPEKMVNGIMMSGLLWNVATTWISNRIQNCDENSSPIDRTTTVTKVEIRAWSNSVDSCGTLTAFLRPAFTLGNGDTHSWIPIRDAGADEEPSWSEWFDITNDTNAPATWTWDDVNNLDVDHWMVKTVCGNPNSLNTGRIEIRVTWHDSVTLSGPMPDTLNNKLDKQLKPFNLWRDYKIADEGIEGQPLNFEGVEVGVCYASGNEYGMCFPMCDPFCFDDIIAASSKSAALVAQEKFEKIDNWIENNYNVMIEEFGECFDAEFAIKDFTYQSMNHPSNYKWRITLEKAGN